LHILTTIPFPSSLARAHTVCPSCHQLEAGIQADFILRHPYCYSVRANTLSTVLQSSAYGLYRYHACACRIASVCMPGELRTLNHTNQCYWYFISSTTVFFVETCLL